MQTGCGGWLGAFKTQGFAAGTWVGDARIGDGGEGSEARESREMTRKRRGGCDKDREIGYRPKKSFIRSRSVRGVKQPEST
jgi:hypothetical protein